MTVIASATGGPPSRGSTYAAAYARAVEPMSPRFASAITSSPASRAYAHASSNARIPCEPKASKNASCGLTATHTGAAASIRPRQKRVIASPRAAGPSPASPCSSTGMRSSTGSSPSTSWLRLRSTHSATRSANTPVIRLDLGHAQHSMQRSGGPGRRRRATRNSGGGRRRNCATTSSSSASSGASDGSARRASASPAVELQPSARRAPCAPPRLALDAMKKARRKPGSAAGTRRQNSLSRSRRSRSSSAVTASTAASRSRSRAASSYRCASATRRELAPQPRQRRRAAARARRPRARARRARRGGGSSAGRAASACA